MKIIAVANVEQQQEIQEKKMNAAAEIVFTGECPEPAALRNFDTLWLLKDDADPRLAGFFPGRPVLVNSVIRTLDAYPPNVARINGWPGFLHRSVWEAATGDPALFDGYFESLDCRVVFVKDEPGLVSARVIAMIINEACHALGEQVGSEPDIDLAMQLGTHYPRGPFDWLRKIGPTRVCQLLDRLAVADSRYQPAPELIRRCAG